MISTKDLEKIIEIASDLEPEYRDWSYGEHTWCLDAAEECEQYLRSRNISFLQNRPPDPGSMNSFAGCSYHAWITLSDGTIIDPTIKQFFLPNGLGTDPLLPALYPRQDLWIIHPHNPEYSLYLYL